MLKTVLSRHQTPPHRPTPKIVLRNSASQLLPTPAIIPMPMFTCIPSTTSGLHTSHLVSIHLAYHDALILQLAALSRFPNCQWSASSTSTYAHRHARRSCEGLFDCCHYQPERQALFPSVSVLLCYQLSRILPPYHRLWTPKATGSPTQHIRTGLCDQPHSRLQPLSICETEVRL